MASKVSEMGSAIARGFELLADRIWPGSQFSKLMTSSFVRGGVWAVVLTAAFAIPAFLASPAYSQFVSAEYGTKLAVLLALMSAGVSTNLADLPDMTLGMMLDVQGSARPTLVTLVLVMIAYRFGRRIVSTPASKGANVGRFAAWGLGAGFSLVLFLVSLAASGTFVFGFAVNVAPMDLLDIVSVFCVVAIPAWLGQIRSRNALDPGRASYWAWGRSALGYTIVLFVAVSSVIAIIWSVIASIEPDFAVPAPEIVASNPFAALSSTQFWIGFAIVLAYLPTLTIWSLAAGLGGSIGFDFGGATQSIIDLLSPLVSLSPITSFSLAGDSNNTGAFFAILALVVVISAIAGVVATRRWVKTGATSADLLRAIASISLLIVGVQFFTQWSIAWTYTLPEGNPAMTASILPLAISSGTISIGSSLISVLLLGWVISLAGYSASRWLSSWLPQAFPRIFSLLGQPKHDKESHSLGAVIFGRAVTTAIIATVAIDLTIVTVERTWGSNDSPTSHLGEYAQLLQGDDLDAAKNLLGGETPINPWFADSALKAAQIPAENAPSFSASTKYSDNWQVGNTEADANITWTIGGSDLLASYPATAKMELLWNSIDHAIWTVNFKPTAVSINLSNYLTGVDGITVETNGVETVPGTYSAIPGTYVFTSTGYKLIAPSEISVSIGSTNESVSLGETVLLPDGADADLNAALDAELEKCKAVSVAGESPCFNAADVQRSGEVSRGSIPAKYYSKSTGNFRAKASGCDTNTVDVLLSAESVVRSTNCEIGVNYDVTYYDSKTVQVPRYENQRYDACPTNFYNYCWKTRRVQVGTTSQLAAGAVISRVTFMSIVGIELKVNGSMDSQNVFTAD
ncbi:MAG: hypothetical protein RL294_1132 [Actinomycetota bacterium]|jgi:hypothetical protein